MHVSRSVKSLGSVHICVLLTLRRGKSCCFWVPRSVGRSQNKKNLYRYLGLNFIINHEIINQYLDVWEKNLIFTLTQLLRKILIWFGVNYFFSYLTLVALIALISLVSLVSLDSLLFFLLKKQRYLEKIIFILLNLRENIKCICFLTKYFFSFA